MLVSAGADPAAPCSHDKNNHLESVLFALTQYVFEAVAMCSQANLSHVQHHPDNSV